MRGRQLQSRYGRTAPFVWRHGLIWLKKIAMDRTQTGGTGTKAKTTTGEVLTTEDTEGTEEKRKVFLCALCALCDTKVQFLRAIRRNCDTDKNEKSMGITKPQRAQRAQRKAF